MTQFVRSYAPIRVVQGSAGTIIFPFLTAALNTELNSLGNDVTYRTFPGVTHGEIASAGDASS